MLASSIANGILQEGAATVPIPGFSMSSSQLVSRWRKRQREIIEQLPANLLAEYRKLEGMITSVYAEEKKRSREQDSKQKTAAEGDNSPDDEEGLGLFAPPPRTPLSAHKKKLIKFLAGLEQPVTRGNIASATRIPPASLSELLKGPEFEQVRHGLWKLRKE
jgi:hypothetical protein